VAALDLLSDSRGHGLGFGEHDLNRGRPRRAAPTVRSEGFDSVEAQGSEDFGDVEVGF